MFARYFLEGYPQAEGKHCRLPTRRVVIFQLNPSACRLIVSMKKFASNSRCVHRICRQLYLVLTTLLNTRVNL